MLDIKIVLSLLRTESNKLSGNMASYDKFNDKIDFIIKIKQNIETINALFEQYQEATGKGGK